MRPRSTAILACRIIAVVFIAEGIVQVIGIVSAAGGEFAGLGPLFAHLIGYLLIGVFLWATAEDLARVMTRGTSDEDSPSRSLLDMGTVAFAVLGVVLMARAVPALIAIAASPSESLGVPGGELTITGSRGAAVAANLTQLAIGAFLFLSANGVAEAVARPAGRDRRESVGPPV